MKRLSFLFTLLLPAGLLLTQAIAPARANPTGSPNSEWAKFANVSQQFMQGCVGQEALPPNLARTKRSYCQCALSAYQTRYTPQVFSQINAYSVKAGKDGPALVNLMMLPELSQCSSQTGFNRPQ